MVKNLGIREILASNLKALMAKSKHSQGDLFRLSNVAQSTIGRVINMQVDATVATIEAIAEVYKLQPWQLLVPNLDPSNPPMLREISDKEREFYEKIKMAAQEIAKYQ